MWENNDIDIKVTPSVYNKKTDKDYTISSYLKSLYSFSKEYYYYNFAWIKETKFWEKYIYYFMLNNKYKFWDEYKDLKKYKIVVNFLENKNEEKYYNTTLEFSFDKVESKKIIDNFINGIKTNSWESPYKIWELKIWENLIKEEEFEFKN